jgi:hypothetical protein
MQENFNDTPYITDHEGSGMNITTSANTLQIGQEIVIVEHFLTCPDFNPDHFVEATEATTWKVIKMTPAFAWLETQKNGQSKQQRFEKSYLLNKVEDEHTLTLIKNSIPVKKQPKTNTQEYQEYLLTDPRDDSINYVGISKNVQLRYKQHCQCEGLNLEKNLWVQGLLREGLLPGLILGEKIIGLKAAQEKEQQSIQYYLSIGAPLKNVVIRGGKDE